MSDVLRTYFGAKTPSSITASPLDDAFTRYLLAVYRGWYTLPLKSTRARLDELRFHLAADLHEPTTDERAALRSFVAAAEKLRGVADALTQGARGGDLRAEVMWALDGGGALSAAGRASLSALAAAPDPAYAAISRMAFHPTATRARWPEVRKALTVYAERLPADLNAQIEAIWSKLDADLARPLAWDEANQLIFGALAKIEALPKALRLVWEQLLAIKVESADEIRAMPGGGLTEKGVASGGPIDAHISFSYESLVAETAGAEPPTPTTITLFSDVRFPAVVPVSRDLYEALIVRLTTQQQVESVAPSAVHVPFVNPETPQLVDVVVSAPGFSERFDLWRRTIVVYSDHDSQPAIFLLRSDKAGPKRITVDFYHAERLIGSAAFETQVAKAPSSGQARPLTAPIEIAGFLDQPPPPADLELRIVYGADEQTLFFTLHSIRSGLGYHWTPMGETKLAVRNPQEHLEHEFERLNQMAAQDVVGLDPAQAVTAMREMAAIGERLWELLPDLFRQEYWQRIKPLRDAGKLCSLLITSDEPWIPWELVKPFKSDPYLDEISEEDGFWAETFHICRWLAGRGPAARVEVAAARMVAPDLDLAYVEEEKKHFDRLAEKGIKIAPPLRTREEVLSIARSGGVELLHFATHGVFDPQQPNRSRVSLANDAGLTPDDLAGTATQGLRKSRPVVVMNACSLGNVGFTLTRLGGWAPRWINDAFASAFIGALWEVNDELAADFTQHLYSELFSGATLGEAMYTARQALRIRQPANPTWLAYTLYGDPNSRLVVKAETNSQDS